jgi:hypothetical protein
LSFQVSSKGKKRQFAAYAGFFVQHAAYDYDRAEAHLSGIINTVSVMRDEQNRLKKTRLIASMQDVITGPQRRRSHTLCSYCEEFIARIDYHDCRNCPKRVVAMEGEMLVRMQIRLGFRSAHNVIQCQTTQ